MIPPYRPFIAFAGLLGATGVVLAAQASHSGLNNFGIAANFLLFHAPTLLALGLMVPNRIARLAGYVLALGVVVFAGDLAVRDLLGHALFPLAAPLGGGALILGWLLVAGSAFVRQR